MLKRRRGEAEKRIGEEERSRGKEKRRGEEEGWFLAIRDQEILISAGEEEERWTGT